MPQQLTPAQFVAKWKPVELSERAASQSHFNDLCELLGQPNPTDHDATGAEYTFEKGVTPTAGASRGAAGDRGFADVWWRGKFGWEYKRKGKYRDLNEAYRQLCQYREALENPPLLIVSDIARTEIHTNFTGTVKQVHAIALDDMAEPRSLDLLRRVFTNPESFKPDVTAARVARTAPVIGRCKMSNEGFASQFEQLASRFDSITPDKFSRPELLAEQIAHYAVQAGRLLGTAYRAGHLASEFWIQKIVPLDLAAPLDATLNCGMRCTSDSGEVYRSDEDRFTSLWTFTVVRRRRSAANGAGRDAAFQTGTDRKHLHGPETARRGGGNRRTARSDTPVRVRPGPGNRIRGRAPAGHVLIDARTLRTTTTDVASLAGLRR